MQKADRKWVRGVEGLVVNWRGLFIIIIFCGAICRSAPICSIFRGSISISSKHRTVPTSKIPRCTLTLVLELLNMSNILIKTWLLFPTLLHCSLFLAEWVEQINSLNCYRVKYIWISSFNGGIFIISVWNGPALRKSLNHSTDSVLKLLSHFSFFLFNICILIFNHLLKLHLNSRPADLWVLYYGMGLCVFHVLALCSCVYRPAAALLHANMLLL